MNGDALGSKHVADLVRGAPILVGFGGGTHVENQIEQGGGFLVVSTISTCAFRLKSQNLTQELVERVLDGRDVFCTEGNSASCRTVDGLHPIEQRGNQDGCVEVVVHGGMAFGRERLGIESGFPLGGLECVQRLHGLLQLGKAFFGRLQGFVAEVKRAGIVAHEHEKTHSHGSVSLVE